MSSVHHSRRRGHARLEHAQLRALGPRPLRRLPVKDQLAVVARAAEDLAVVVKVDAPHGRPVTVELGDLAHDVRHLARLTRRLPLGGGARLGEARAEAGLVLVLLVRGADGGGEGLAASAGASTAAGLGLAADEIGGSPCLAVVLVVGRLDTEDADARAEAGLVLVLLVRGADGGGEGLAAGAGASTAAVLGLAADEIGGGPCLAVVLVVGRLDAEDADVAVLAG
ncbi:hypothetical protein BN1723_001794 [Verticillium longisporum]|uniref:Uncharacterized protein n=1 Tax=Verticillium longisporum TaxID=100787 RepID=A0A0G4KNY1_VERLO|nr:hypothetical protein BN1723_001794 [Verticillium longisporum]